MKVYSKPIAQMELFRLDSEFAGGCSQVFDQNGMASGKNMVDDAMRLVLNGDFLYSMAELAGLNNEYNESDLSILFEKYKNGTCTEQERADAFSVMDNFIAHINDDNAYNLTAGLCYYTFASAKGKNFS